MSEPRVGASTPPAEPALLRFGFFVLLGLGSWLGAALVERLLENVLG